VAKEISMKKLVVLTGAGISQESGIKTFRDANGLWDEYKVEDVATPDGWKKNPKLVQEFYNIRRREINTVHPNPAHYALAKLEEDYDVTIITQNIDNLHERAGSTKVIHLHGIITKSQSTLDPTLVYEIEGTELKMGDKCEKGSQLRPHVVWFGEDVPLIETAAGYCFDADIFILCGTSLNVYPAAGLIRYIPHTSPKYVVDPSIPKDAPHDFTKIEEKASIGIPALVELLMS
jgi:NAD-dependent deacetylase